MKVLGHAGGMRRSLLLSTVGLAVVASAVFGVANAKSKFIQSRAQDADLPAPKFEFIAIKANNSGGMAVKAINTEDGFVATNASLELLIQLAYGVVQDYQITGLPDWQSTEKFDIVAKMSGSAVDELRKVIPYQRLLAQQRSLQSLLTNNFKLKLHTETKELPIYSLVVAENGSKLQESKSGYADPKGIPVPDGRGGTGSMRMGEMGTIAFQAVSIDFLTQFLSLRTGRTVLNKTGLKAGDAKYDFTLRWMPERNQLLEAAPETLGSQRGESSALPPPLLTAIQEQLGLRLESGKGPVEVIVIDHVERPTVIQ